MLSVAEARRLVLQHSRSKSAVRLPAADCLGLVLAEEITSDIDSPPFDKSMVDGYAVRSADLNDGQGELEVIEEIAAGALAQKPAAPGQCWRIMTGAPIPAGADAVIMHERTRFLDPDPSPAQVEFTLDDFRKAMEQMRRMGPLKKIMGIIPGMSAMADMVGDANSEEQLNRLFRIIDSMTPEERRNPNSIRDPIRQRRIAADAVAEPNEVNDLIKQFNGMASMMKKLAGMGIRERMRAVQRIHASRSGAVESETRSNAGFGRLGRVRFDDDRFRAGQNIMRRGTAMRFGDVLMTPGHLIRPIELGLMAEVGHAEVSVIPRPTVAVLSTGNELVPSDQIPGNGQIRNSNGPMLAAAIRAAGAEPVELGIRPDETTALREAIEEGLKSDVLVISGGVSAGGLDLIPGLLNELGVEQVFHKVSLKPGKPIWFGRRSGSAHPSPPAGSTLLTAGPLPQGERGEKRAPRPRITVPGEVSSLVPRPTPLAPALVFGLPGNPVSSLVCFELFVRPAIEILAGKKVSEELATVPAELIAPFVHRGDRPTYYPAVLKSAGGKSTIAALGWSGSADMRTLASANALAIFAAGTREYAAGEQIQCLPL